MVLSKCFATVLRHSYSVETSATFIVVDVARRLITQTKHVLHIGNLQVIKILYNLYRVSLIADFPNVAQTFEDTLL